MWQTTLIPGYKPDGTPILSVLAKETYRYTNGTMAEVDTDAPIELYEEDSYYGEGDPTKDPLKHESDLVAFKPSTDVIFIGKAECPNGKKARFFDLTVAVNELFKTVRVIGNRTALVTPSGLTFSEPELFESMPLHFGLAYGGSDSESDPEYDYVYAPNPIGKGYIIKNNPLVLHGLELPNLEDPHHLLTPDSLVLKNHERWKTMPVPCALGYRSKHGIDRMMLIQKGVEPGREGDADIKGYVHPSFYNGASMEMTLPLLQGGERITMMYMDPEHPKFHFQLPAEQPMLWLNTGIGIREAKATLQTVEVYKPTNQVTLLWRGEFVYPGPEAFGSFTALEYGATTVIN
ncbi:MAG: DUF2169 domain-containing protein [Fibrobacterales bacterium]